MMWKSIAIKSGKFCDKSWGVLCAEKNEFLIWRMGKRNVDFIEDEHDTANFFSSHWNKKDDKICEFPYAKKTTNLLPERGASFGPRQSYSLIKGSFWMFFTFRKSSVKNVLNRLKILLKKWHYFSRFQASLSVPFACSKFFTYGCFKNENCASHFEILLCLLSDELNWKSGRSRKAFWRYHRLLTDHFLFRDYYFL